MSGNWYDQNHGSQPWYQQEQARQQREAELKRINDQTNAALAKANADREAAQKTAVSVVNAELLRKNSSGQPSAPRPRTTTTSGGSYTSHVATDVKTSASRKPKKSGLPGGIRFLGILAVLGFGGYYGGPAAVSFYNENYSPLILKMKSEATQCIAADDNDIAEAVAKGRIQNSDIPKAHSYAVQMCITSTRGFYQHTMPAIDPPYSPNYSHTSS